MTAPVAQSRLASVVEASVNTVVSFLIGVALNLVILPLLGYPITAGDSAILVAAFTVVSFARSYVLRRVFDYFARAGAMR